METEFELKWGIGMRTAALIAQTVERFSSTVVFTHDTLKINGKSLMQLMLLNVKAGSHVRLSINGPDEAAAMQELTGLFTYGPRLDRCPHKGCDSTPALLEYGKSGATYACSHGHTWDLTGWPDKPEMVTPAGRTKWS